MSETMAPVQAWLASPMAKEVAEAIERLRRAPDVQQVAVMPDVHIATEVCVGVVVATTHRLYPQAVGGDIGCGMLAAAFDIDAAALRDAGLAGRVLARLGRAVPARRRNRRSVIGQPEAIAQSELSDPTLEAVRRQDGVLEFATLGSGNHFIELQSDEEGRLWMMVHSGSRALGQAIVERHRTRAGAVGQRLWSLDAGSEEGAAYLHDVSRARAYAEASRRAMAEEVARVLRETADARICWETLITTDHNHVGLERHSGRELWIHRKGAMPAWPGQRGVLPGSMGALSFHIEGRGHEAALCSSAHGAGRAMSRGEARAKVSERALRRQMESVWFDVRLAGLLRDEAPSAYKDIREVLAAQRELVKVIRTLRPVLNYKGA